MLKNYLKIAWRNALHKKLFSGINIVGLALGILTVLFISLYVADEVGYDRFHSKAENTYMIRHNYFMADQDYDWHETAVPLAEKMRDQFPEVEHLTSTTAPFDYSFRYEDSIVDEIRTLHADGEFFNVFDFNLLAGNPQTALSEPNSIVISENAVQQLFADQKNVFHEQALGKTLILDGEEYTVTGVLEAPVEKSHLQFDAIVSIHGLINNGYSKETWLPAGIVNYVVLKEGTKIETLNSKFKQIEEDFLWPQLNKHLGASIAKLENNRAQYGYYLEPILDIHLVREGTLKYILIFSTTGFLILFLVIINFINLFISSATGRIKEVGIRKTLGAGKNELAKQFFVEATLLCTIAFTLAISAVPMVIGPFNNFVGTELSLAEFSTPYYGFILLGLLTVIILFSAAYPAFYLGSVKTIKAVKGVANGKHSESKSGIHKPFIVFQYAVSISLLICFITLFEQLAYMQEKNPGFAKENVVVMPGAYSFEGNRDVFKEKLTALSAVQSASFSYAVPGSRFDALSLFRKEGEDKDFQFHWINTDYDFLRTYDIEILEGRNFSEDFPTDTAAVLLNQVAAAQLGKDGLIDSYLTNHVGEKIKVIGVIGNFNFEHFKNEVKPLAIALSRKDSYELFVSVKLNPGNPQAALTKIESYWSELNSGASFRYSFMDERLNSLYQIEERAGKIIGLFTVLAVIICSLGLFGLITFSAAKRTKEVGIRKVLGASEWEITYLLSKEFLLLVLIAFGLTVPITYMALEGWLQQFANRIEIGMGTFLISGVVILLLSGLILSFQIIKTTLMNPVESLKSE
ncbi:putative ABC transport system permease protein [Algoriphagus sp. 4150]|uniref:ABC transporter permease n=1 Tax=Algoriphagus sp. 4150 TaxID=2817756 RepID=UPI002858245A|nr:ABC transporter permease [Algoriphagus sp. 4150]MDR7132448.1 putative ABC transport system permease protein [Algoriphagus sp. 4150]